MQRHSKSMLEKIAMGKLNKFYKENTLLNQDFVRDNKMTVGQFVKQADQELKVVGFIRLMLGSIRLSNVKMRKGRRSNCPFLF